MYLLYAGTLLGTLEEWKLYWFCFEGVRKTDEGQQVRPSEEDR